MELITTRTAVPEDLEILLGFEQEIIRAERPFDVTLADEPINYYDIASMLQQAHILLVVALAGSEIIGSGFARIEDSKRYLKHAKHAYLGFMYVKPEYRGKGVNKKVILALQQWALSRGITEFILEVYSENLPAIAAYEKAGFRKNMIEMRTRLAGQK